MRQLLLLVKASKTWQDNHNYDQGYLVYRKICNQRTSYDAQVQRLHESASGPMP